MCRINPLLLAALPTQRLRLSQLLASFLQTFTTSTNISHLLVRLIQNRSGFFKLADTVSLARPSRECKSKTHLFVSRFQTRMQPKQTFLLFQQCLGRSRTRFLTFLVLQRALRITFLQTLVVKAQQVLLPFASQVEESNNQIQNGHDERFNKPKASRLPTRYRFASCFYRARLSAIVLCCDHKIKFCLISPST